MPVLLFSGFPEFSTPRSCGCLDYRGISFRRPILRSNESRVRRVQLLYLCERAFKPMVKKVVATKAAVGF